MKFDGYIYFFSEEGGREGKTVYSYCIKKEER